ncbi:hypothetical protein N1F89_03715 [Aquibium sp. A9E412]|uniref:hypothetical protein n=1 Tax=Aquibium sp. A9E412 TaxID=2976767 RepID=UPI0025B24CA7|nr:hypothetical protein [Aquibium sp. A9E412]MDN2565318.1 hypothetical protein [Aquibium sp. A9E412]
MNRILIAAFATVAFAGAAAAQQAPVLQGNYSANVLDHYNGASGVAVGAGVDRFTTAGIERAPRADAGLTAFDEDYGR